VWLTGSSAQGPKWLTSASAPIVVTPQPVPIKLPLPPTLYPPMSKITALRKQISALEAQVERITKSEMSAAVAKVKSLMADFGVTIEHLTGAVLAKESKPSAAANKTKSASVAKYADPKTGKTWSGFGRAPAWIAGAKHRDAFLVSAGSADNNPKSWAPTNKAKTVSVAKYADPKSGKTWSGFGRAPAWLAGAKNRDAFLVGAVSIASKPATAKKKPSVTEATPAVKSVQSKAAAVKKTAATKRATPKAEATKNSAEKPSAAKKAVTKKVAKAKTVATSLKVASPAPAESPASAA
jgi:DNA-binding protein H-NS